MIETRFERVAAYPDAILPRRATISSAGYDLFLAEDTVILPGQVKVAHTGVKLYINWHCFGQISIRSSIPLKKSLLIPNAPGIIDADYVDNPDNEGEIGVELYNFGTQPIHLSKGDKIAQLIITTFYTIDTEEEFAEERTGGFGSTN